MNEYKIKEVKQAIRTLTLIGWEGAWLCQSNMLVGLLTTGVIVTVVWPSSMKSWVGYMNNSCILGEFGLKDSIHVLSWTSSPWYGNEMVTSQFVLPSAHTIGIVEVTFTFAASELSVIAKFRGSTYNIKMFLPFLLFFTFFCFKAFIWIDVDRGLWFGI